MPRSVRMRRMKTMCSRGCARNAAAVSAEMVLSGPGPRAACTRARIRESADREPEIIVRRCACRRIARRRRDHRAVRAAARPLCRRHGADVQGARRRLYHRRRRDRPRTAARRRGCFAPRSRRIRPIETMLKAIPTALVTCQEPGLIGCAALAERMMQRTRGVRRAVVIACATFTPVPARRAPRYDAAPIARRSSTAPRAQCCAA